MQVNWFRVAEWLSAGIKKLCLQLLLEKFEVSAVWVEVSSCTREEKGGGRFWKVCFVPCCEGISHNLFSVKWVGWELGGYGAQCVIGHLWLIEDKMCFCDQTDIH